MRSPHEATCRRIASGATQGRTMSLILALSIEELMQPGFTGTDRAAGDPRSDASFSPGLGSCAVAIPSRSQSEFLTRAGAEDSKYCLKNSAVMNAQRRDDTGGIGA